MSLRSLLFEPDLLLWEDALRADLALELDDAGTVVGAPLKSGAKGATRLAGKLLLPGFVNAHSHAFQRLIRGRTEYVAAGAAADDFWSWRELMYRAAQTLSPEQLYAVSRQAFLEMAKAGITQVGEFHYLHHQADGAPYEDRELLAKVVVRAARDVGLRVVLLRVAYARAGFQRPENPQQRRFIDRTPDVALEAIGRLRRENRDPLVGFGLAPHSVRAVPADWLRFYGAHKPELTGPLHMHVAEQPAEIHACVAEHRLRPVALLEACGLLKPHFTAVHAIHLDPDEVLKLGRARAQVCACPSTERNLGDGIIPADALVKAGVSLSLGSDSQAHISLLNEARQLDGHLRLLRLKRAVLDPGGGHPSGLALRLLHFATVGGARALGTPTGMLRPGAPGDFFSVDLAHSSLLGVDQRALLAAVMLGAEAGAVRDVFVQGRAIVSDGQHAAETETAEAYVKVARELFS